MTAEAQLAALLDAAHVHAPDRYSWLGQSFRGDVARLLGQRIYADFYLPGAVAPASGRQSWRLDLTRGAHTARLSEASPAGPSPDTGWTFTGWDADLLIVERAGFTLRVPRSAIPDGPLPRHGEPVTVLLPAERRGASGGFHTVMGGAGSGADAAEIDRLYWNATPDGAPLLLERFAQACDREGLPFRMKVVNDVRGYGRCDTAVTYTPRGRRAVALAVAADVHRRCRDLLRPRVPSLTLRLARGLGFAEDPGGGESFGAHRSRLLGDAMAEAGRHGLRDTPRRLGLVAERFRHDGLDAARPHMGRGGGDRPDPRLPA